MAAGISAILLTLLLYGVTAQAYFLSDDFVLIADASRGNLFRSWGPFLRPLVVLSYAVDYRIWGFDPFGFHLTNMLLHAACDIGVASLAFCLARAAAIDRPRAIWLAALSAAMFLVLPAHSEVVSWISGRGDALATAFALCSLTLYIRYLDAGKTMTLLLSGGVYLGALFSKELATTLPSAVILLGLALVLARPRDRSVVVRRTLLATSVFVVLLLAYLLIRKTIFGSFLSTDYLVFDIRTLARNAVEICIRLVVAPEFGPALFQQLKRPMVLIGLGVGGIVLALALFFRASRAEKSILFALLFSFSISLIPILSLGVNLFDTQGERHLYYPSAIACITITAALLFSIRWLPIVVPSICIYLVFSAISLTKGNENWVAAGKLSKSIADQIISEGVGSRALVISVADNYRGAYVFRNGLGEATSIFAGQEEVSTLRPMLTHTVHDQAQHFRMIPERKNRQYKLCGFGPNTVVLPTEYMRTSVDGCVRVTVPAIPPDVPIFYFTGGQMVFVGHGSDSPLRFK